MRSNRESVSLINMAACVQYFKHRCGKPLRSGEKQIILNVYCKFCEKYPSLAIEDIVKLNAEFSGVSGGSINAAKSKIVNKGQLSTPGKTLKRKRHILEEECNEFVCSAIRRKVHFFLKDEP